jgi:hypothetical protein
MAIAVAAILLLAGAYYGGGAVGSIDRLAGGTRSGAWLGVEGYLPGAWPELSSGASRPFSGPRWDGRVRFSRARAEMQSGSFQASERMWSDLIRDGLETEGSYNNRGVVRALLGKKREALSDFEAAVAQTPSGGPAHWNAYQMYLEAFQLEQAARIQSAAWGSIGEMPPFDFRADEMTRGELIPSPLRAEGVRGYLAAFRDVGGREAEESPFGTAFFRILPVDLVPAFLAAGCLWVAGWAFLSRTVWLHGACRSCGSLSMVARTRETTDICNSCRAQVGGGLRGGEERERRILDIRSHRRYVRACSVLVPGSGALWAGKDLRAMAYGIVLCVPLGALTVSLGARASDRVLLTDLQTFVAGVAVACAALLWAAGAWWGWRSFEELQIRYNIASERL